MKPTREYYQDLVRCATVREKDRIAEFMRALREKKDCK